MKINLSAIVDALDLSSDEGSAYLDRQTGDVHQFGPEELALAEEEEPSVDLPDWQREIVEVARQVFSDDSNRYLELPDRWKVHEYGALERFASSQRDPEVAQRLLSSIVGRGAFRRFKDAVHDLGIADQWYEYRHSFLLEVARDWCETNDVPYELPS